MIDATRISVRDFSGQSSCLPRFARWARFKYYKTPGVLLPSPKHQSAHHLLPTTAAVNYRLVRRTSAMWTVEMQWCHCWGHLPIYQPVHCCKTKPLHNTTLLACNFRDKRLTAYIFIYSSTTQPGYRSNLTRDTWHSGDQVSLCRWLEMQQRRARRVMCCSPRSWTAQRCPRMIPRSLLNR